jgi:hypothetical protein
MAKKDKAKEKSEASSKKKPEALANVKTITLTDELRIVARLGSPHFDSPVLELSLVTHNNMPCLRVRGQEHGLRLYPMVTNEVLVSSDYIKRARGE